LDREDTLTHWRLGILLGFNGLLLNAAEFPDPECSLSVVGAMVSGSVLCASILGSIARFSLHCSWPVEEGESPVHKGSAPLRYYAGQMVGPHIFAGIVFSGFWLCHVFPVG
jgi:hypothetical protein